MLHTLKENLQVEFCPNYWIKEINLFDLTVLQFVSKRAMLASILKNPKNYVTDEWLEYTRYVRRNCCYCGDIKQVIYSTIVDPENEEDCSSCVCCRISCDEENDEFCSTKYMMDPLSLDVY